MKVARAASSALALVCLVALAALLAVEIVRTAWMSDDAYVTLRTLDNAARGHALSFNPVERVQAYTHPLWMVLLAAGYTVWDDPWRMPMVLGMGVTGVSLLLLATGAAWTRWSAVVAFALLAASKSYVDYATSGLENPLTHLLLVLLAFVSFHRERPRAFAAVLLLALLALTRPDAVLLAGPLAAATVLAACRAGLWREAFFAPLGLVPAIVWVVFAVVYYGDPLPNTAYAKLGADVPLDQLRQQGLAYLAWSWRVDPITLAGIGAGAVAGLLERDLRTASLTAGIVLYVAFVVSMGGDFMGGRFLVAPLFLAALAIARLSWGPIFGIVTVVLVLGASVQSPWSPITSGPDYVRAPPSDGVVDERGYYWHGTGWRAEGAGRGPTHPFWTDGLAARDRPIAVKSVIGLYGFAAGPGHHVVDRLGLADPLLARLPAEPTLDWRIGHFRREIPDGYLPSVLGENQITDPEIRATYDRVRLVTRGPPLRVERFRAIGETLCARFSR